MTIQIRAATPGTVSQWQPSGIGVSSAMQHGQSTLVMFPAIKHEPGSFSRMDLFGSVSVSTSSNSSYQGTLSLARRDLHPERLDPLARLVRLRLLHVERHGRDLVRLPRRPPELLAADQRRDDPRRVLHRHPVAVGLHERQLGHDLQHRASSRSRSPSAGRSEARPTHRTSSSRAWASSRPRQRPSPEPSHSADLIATGAGTGRPVVNLMNYTA